MKVLLFFLVFIKLLETRKKLKYTSFELEERVYQYQFCFPLVRLMYHNWNRPSQQARKDFDFPRIMRNAVTLGVLCAWTFDWKYSINLKANQCSLEK